MIIVRTPLRVSFFGGGTDHPTWFKHHGPGAVLSTSIDQYVYITIRPLPPIFDFKYRVVWSRLEQCNTIDEIQHPVVREVLRHFAPDCADGYEVVYHADLPARSGLGSSSAFTVAALHAMFRYRNQDSDKMRLALEAIRVEQELLGEPVGSQDQTAVAFGGLNRIDFNADGSLLIDPIAIDPRRKAELDDRLMMFFTGFTRDAGGIEKTKIDTFRNRTAEMARLYGMVDRGRKILENPFSSLDDFGALLHEGWQYKKALSSAVSSGPIDALYAAALQAGALGGKLLGAGGGGFLLFYVPPDRQDAVKQALAGLGAGATHVPIHMEEEGSTVVLHRPDLTMNYDRSLDVGRRRNAV